MLKKQFSAQIKYVCVVCAGLAHRCLGCSRASVRCGSTTMVHSVSTRTVICWTGRCFELQTFAWTGRCFCVVDIRLDWQVFNEEKETDQLLDCIVTYGQLFPLKNAGGDEVVPKLPGKFFMYFFYHAFIIIDRT